MSGWTDGLSQDYNGDLGRWFADRLGAREQLRRDMQTRPDSPCIAICDTLYQEFCTGCGRHYLEVANWSTLSQEQKDKVWVRIETEATSKRFTTYQERAK